ncbi:MAG: hypothetical protein ACP5G2_01155 [Candidatus Bipolaricaulaceae bacterium]
MNKLGTLVAALVIWTGVACADPPEVVKFGISLRGTHLVGLFLEYRAGGAALRASLGTAVPWLLQDVGLAVQLRG